MNENRRGSGRVIRLALIGILSIVIIWAFSFLYSVHFIENVLPGIEGETAFTEQIILKILSIYTVVAIPSIAGIIITAIGRYGLREAALSLPGERNINPVETSPEKPGK